MIYMASSDYIYANTASAGLHANSNNNNTHRYYIWRQYNIDVWNTIFAALPLKAPGAAHNITIFKAFIYNIDTFIYRTFSQIQSRSRTHTSLRMVQHAASIQTFSIWR